MWVALPIPAEAKLSSPGFSFVALTRSVTVFQDFEGDTTFPELGKEWATIDTKDFDADEKNEYNYSFIEYDRYEF